MRKSYNQVFGATKEEHEQLWGITEKQRRKIKFIEHWTNRKFEGNTRKEAREFIHINLEFAYILYYEDHRRFCSDIWRQRRWSYDDGDGYSAEWCYSASWFY